MKISTRAQYGLRAMIYLAKNNGTSLKEISTKESIPFDYLEKILSRLEKTGLLKAKRGATGGYFLARAPQRIKIGEIVRAAEGKMILVKCVEGKHLCLRAKECLARNIWQKTQAALDSALDSVTLSELIKNKHPKHEKKESRPLKK